MAAKTTTRKRGKQSKSTGTKKRQASSAKRSTAKSGAKQTAKKSGVKTRSVRLKSASGNVRTVRRPVEQQFGTGTARVEQFGPAAVRASELACVDTDGKPIGRAPISSPKVQMVAQHIGRRKPADVLHRVIGESSATKSGQMARKYAAAQIGQTDLPDGARARIGEMAKAIGDPKQHKMNGRALVAALVGLAEHPPKSARQSGKRNGKKNGGSK